VCRHSSIDLSNNNFTGGIPTSLSRLMRLEYVLLQGGGVDGMVVRVTRRGPCCVVR
jgi:hypothetical protein